MSGIFAKLFGKKEKSENKENNGKKILNIKEGVIIGTVISEPEILKAQKNENGIERVFCDFRISAEYTPTRKRNMGVTVYYEEMDNVVRVGDKVAVIGTESSFRKRESDGTIRYVPHIFSCGVNLLKKDIVNENEIEYSTRYDEMKGRAFLIQYFIDHGITNDELDLYGKWDGFFDVEDMIPDDEGLNYAKSCVDKIIAYRDISPYDVYDNMNSAPWFFPDKKIFKRKKDSMFPYSIAVCYYNGINFMYGVGKKEKAVTSDMNKKGKWMVYMPLDKYKYK